MCLLRQYCTYAYVQSSLPVQEVPRLRGWVSQIVLGQQIGGAMGSLKLLVADDHEVVRNGVRCLLEAQPGWQVMAEGSNGREAVEQAQRVKPDVAVLDIGMPSLNGLEAARQMLKNDPRIKIVILTMHDSDNLIREVLKVGARGYVAKTDAIRDLVKAINAGRSGVTFFTAKVAEVVLEGYLDKSGATDIRLTARQREVVQLLAEGRSSKEIAVMLG